MRETGVSTINLGGIWHNTKIIRSEESNVECNDEIENEEIEKVMKEPRLKYNFLSHETRRAHRKEI